MPSNNLRHAYLATRATAGSYRGNLKIKHTGVAEASSRPDTDGPIQLGGIRMSSENRKAREAAAAGDGDQNRVIHRRQSEQQHCEGSRQPLFTPGWEPRELVEGTVSMSFSLQTILDSVHSAQWPSEGN